MLDAIADLKSTTDRRLAVLETRIAGLGRLDGRLAALDARTAGLENLDLHFLQSTVRRLLDEQRETYDALRQIEVKIDKVCSSMATSPEIKRLRETVSSVTPERELDMRLSAIESRLGLRNPLQPAT